jgi:hypothetical protein
MGSRLSEEEIIEITERLNIKAVLRIFLFFLIVFIFFLLFKIL